MATGIDDKDVVMIRYLHPNRGLHNVRGSVSGRDYSYRGGGEMFLVEYRDAVAAPHLFAIMDRPVAERLPEKKVDAQPPPDLLEVKAALEFDFQTLPGVTADIAAAMKADGLSTWEDVLALSEKGLLKYKSIGKVRAAAIFDAVKAMEKSE